MQTCANCGTRVVPTGDGLCPSCRKPFAALIEASVGPQSPPRRVVMSAAPPPDPDTPLPLATPKVLAPGILLTLVAALAVLNGVGVMLTRNEPIKILFQDPGMQRSAEAGQGFARLAGNPIVFIFYLVMLAGGIAMIQQRIWGLAVAGAIIGLIPCSAVCCLSVPASVWSLLVLNKPDVRSSFR